MGIPDIFELLDREVFPNASEHHNVWLWGIDQFLHDGEQAMRERGYRLLARMIWDKGNGWPAAFTVRYSHEYLCWFYKSKLPPIAVAERGKHPTVIRENNRQHSRKPDAAYRLIETLYPTATRMDVFSREPREGWMQFGNQTNHFAQPQLIPA